MRAKNLIFKATSWILNTCLTLLLIVCILVAIVVVLFITQKEKIELKTASYLQEQIGGGAEVTLPQFKINKKYISIYFPSIKVNKADFSVDVKNTEINLQYWLILLAQLEATANFDKIIATVSLKGGGDDKKIDFKIEDFLKQSYLLHSRYIRLFVKELDLLVIKNKLRERFAFKDFEAHFNNKSFNELDANFVFTSNLEQAREPSNFDLFCRLQSKLQTCSLGSKVLTDATLVKINNLVKSKNSQKHFIYKGGDIKHLNFKFNFDFSSFDVALDFENFLIGMPSMKFKSDIKGDFASLNVKHENGESNINFDVYLALGQELFGEVKLKNEGDIVDVVGKNLTSEDLSLYWPKAYLKNVSDWLDDSVYESKIERVFVHVNSPLKNKNDLIVSVDLSDGTLKYSSFLPDVENIKANVLVDNSDDVVINIDSASFKNTSILPNSVAVYDVHKDILKLDVDLESNFGDIANIFVPDQKIQDTINENFTGNTKTKLKLNLKTTGDADEIFKSTNFTADLNIKDFKSPIFKGEEVMLTINKLKGTEVSGITMSKGVNTFFSGKCSPRIDEFFLNLYLNLTKGDLFLQDVMLKGDGVDVLTDVNFNYHSPQSFQKLNLKKLDICESKNVSSLFDVEQKILRIDGDILNLPNIENSDLYSFINSLKEEDFSASSFANDYNIDVYLESALLRELIMVDNIKLISRGKNNFTIYSSLFSGYRNSTEFFFEVNDLGLLVSGLSDFKDLKNGFLTIKAKPNKKGDLEGTISLKKYGLIVSNLDFGSKELKGKFIANDEYVDFKELRLSNAFHTLNVVGKVQKQDLGLNLMAFYTPSTLDINTYLNLIPTNYASTLFDTVTFGTLRDGLLTLTYDIKGTASNPIVSFRAQKTSTQLISKTVKITLIVVGATLILPLIGAIL
jgi:hypothetical protein